MSRFSASFARGFATLGVVFSLLSTGAGAVQAAERDRLEEFLTVTGFDVAIEGLQTSAMAGPAVTGGMSEDFGQQYADLAEEVFDPDLMLNRTLDMLQAVLPDDLVDVAIAFYDSDIGRPIVQAENATVMTDDEVADTEGRRILEAERAENSPRVALYEDMATAIGSMDTTIRAITELQVRFLVAASSAGVIEMSLSEPELRMVIAQQLMAVVPEIAENGLVNSAYAYRDISTEDLAVYVEVLSTPSMQQTYEVMNAVQYQIMIERYEVLGARLAELSPVTDL